jgi:23S rRNA (uracil1939-C5)-methyltransferase
MRVAQPQAPITLTIDNLTSEGEGVGRMGREVCFVPGALPGEQVLVRLQGRRKKVWHALLLEIQQPSPNRRDAPCPHYRRCGGCDLQHLNEEGQLAFKQQRVEREFTRQGITVASWQAPISEGAWHYRRKARIGVRFSKEKQRNFVGFREAGSEHLSDIDRCLILPEHPLYDWAAWRDMLSSLQGRDLITQIETLDTDNALALVLRVLKPLQASDCQTLTDFVLKQAGERPVQLWLNHGRGVAMEALWPPSPEPLLHEVDGVSLVMQPDDFIQVNGAVNRRMVAQAMDWLAPQPDDLIWDLFAGHGNFSIPLARRCRSVLAVEGQASMVSSLQAQAQRLALSLHAEVADLSQAEALASLPMPDKVLLDPPRAGAPEAIRELIARKVPQILYVSCDAATLARDLNQLVAAGYQADKAGIMDMFPQTHHVETMVLLNRKGKRNG